MRDQVEERLKFFETGEAPTKNAEAIRKVLDALALEDEDDEEPALPLLEETPKKDRNKRKGTEDMDVDEQEAPKKRKLSKEEKKALKKEKKQKESAELPTEVSFFHVLVLETKSLRCFEAGRGKVIEEGEEREEGKEREEEKEQGVILFLALLRRFFAMLCICLLYILFPFSLSCSWLGFDDASGLGMVNGVTVCVTK